jgi:hypothetical protein
VWGPWSETWRFTPRGAATPVGVRVEYDADRGIGTLRWESGSVGRRPVVYRVYGSDEKGFTTSDIAYEVNVGNQEEKLPNPFPANFVAETTASELIVVGSEVSVPNANKAFYRVVAVDEQGKRSWSSDYASVPRPLIYTSPVETARLDAEYRYEVATIRSLGDLQCRTMEGTPYNAKFWDVEQPKFTLAEAPGWLTIDGATGVISGVPEAPGRAEVSVGVTTDGVGSARQEFVINVVD